MEVWKIIFLSEWVICRFHVNLQWCTGPWSNSHCQRQVGVSPTHGAESLVVCIWTLVTARCTRSPESVEAALCTLHQRSNDLPFSWLWMHCKQTLELFVPVWDSILWSHLPTPLPLVLYSTTRKHAIPWQAMTRNQSWSFPRHTLPSYCMRCNFHDKLYSAHLGQGQSKAFKTPASYEPTVHGASFRLTSWDGKCQQTNVFKHLNWYNRISTPNFLKMTC